MLGIKLNNEVINKCLRALTALADVQGKSRKRLVKETQTICSRCDDAYSALLVRLLPVKQAFRRPSQLAHELHSLVADGKARRGFKPEGLCTEIDQLLADFQSNLKGIKYSVHLFSIGEIRNTLRSMGNYDQALYRQYDNFMRQIDGIATALQSASPKEKQALVGTARAAITDLETDLNSSVQLMRAAKKRVVKLM